MLVELLTTDKMGLIHHVERRRVLVGIDPALRRSRSRIEVCHGDVNPVIGKIARKRLFAATKAQPACPGAQVPVLVDRLEQ